MRHAGLLRKSSHAALKEGVEYFNTYIDLLFLSCVITDITVVMKMKCSLSLGNKVLAISETKDSEYDTDSLL